MEAFDQVLHAAIKDGILPNAALIAADRDGNIIHQVSSGSFINSPQWADLLPSEGVSAQAKPTAAEPQVKKPFGPDTVCWIASMTKLMATVCALQCVERGLLSLDADATEILPEFKDVQVIAKVIESDDGNDTPVMRPSKGKITLRNLLTHSSGVTYEFVHPKLMAWRQWYSRDMRSKGYRRTQEDRTEVSRAYRVPLVFNPEEGWAYGYGIDLAGLMVERAAGTSLEQYMREHIWEPLGMKDTTFRPMEHPHLRDRMAGMTERDGDGNLVPQQDTAAAGPVGGVRDSAGGGLASTASDYIKLLISLLKNDCKLLKKETVDLMFQPHLKDPKWLRQIHANPAAYGLAGNIEVGTRVDFGLGGILNQEPLACGRSAGALQWGGLPNLFWWINPKDGICGCYFSQLMPSGDPQSFEMYTKFETAVNSAFKKDSGKL